MPDIIVFLGNSAPKTLKSLDNLLAQGKSLQLLTMDSLTFLSLRELGYPVRYAHGTFSHADAEALHNEILRAIHGAYADPLHPHKRDFSAFDTLPLGYFSEFYFLPPMRLVLTHLMAVRRCVETYRPKRVIVIGEEDFARTARMVLRQMDMPFESWESGPIRRMSHIVRKFWKGRKNQWINTIARNVLFETLQLAIVLVLFGLLPSGKKPTGRPVFVFPADTNILPIVKRMESSGKWDLAVYGLHFRLRLNTFKDAFALERSLRFSMIWRAMFAGGYYMLQWFRMKKNKEFTGKFRFLDICYWDAIKPVIKYDLLVTFPKLLLYHKVIAASFERMPKGSVLIVASSEHPIDRISVDAARRHNIASIGTQHGYYDQDTLGRGLLPDFHVSWGDSVREFQLTRGEVPNNIFITGSPRYDAIYNRKDSYNRRDIMGALNLPEDSFIITIVTVWGETVDLDDDIYAIDAVISAIKSLGLEAKCHVVIKPHPTADMEILQMVYDAHKARFPQMSMIGGNLEELLFLSDVCVGQYSTALLEAMFFSKPSIVFDRFAKREWVPYVSRGAALSAGNPEEMTVALKSLLFDGETRKRIIGAHADFIRYAAYKFDNKSTERFCRAIEMLSEGKTPPIYLD